MPDLMYRKWYNVPKMGHNFLPPSTSFFFVFFSSFFRQTDHDYARVLSGKSDADIVRFIRSSAAGLSL